MKTLVGEITSGEVREGDPLPREIDLAQRFSVSRGVIRECLRGLEERGLIHVRHGRGATVAPGREWDLFDMDVLEGVLAGGHGVEVQRECLESRRLLEGEIAALAAERAAASHIRALGEALERMRESAERYRTYPAAHRDFVAADQAFHRTVGDASRNRSLVRMLEPIHKALEAVSERRPPVGELAMAVSDHVRILHAIEQHESEMARAAMLDHLTSSAEREQRRESASSDVA